MEPLPSPSPPNDPNLGELKMSGLKGYVTPSNPAQIIPHLTKKTLKQGSLNLSHPFPSTLPSFPSIQT